jgi:hypothetical protein
MRLSNSNDELINSNDELIEIVVRSSWSQRGEIGNSEATGEMRILVLLAGRGIEVGFPTVIGLPVRLLGVILYGRRTSIG